MTTIKINKTSMFWLWILKIISYLKNLFKKKEKNMATLYVVGIGPGGYDDMSIKAIDTIRKCNVIVGYKTYIDFVAPLIDGKEIISNGMRKEIERVNMAIQKAEENNDVAIISSGDAGIYGMAGLTLQLSQDKDISVEVVPGITASSAAASILGAPVIVPAVKVAAKRSNISLSSSNIASTSDTMCMT